MIGEPNVIIGFTFKPLETVSSTSISNVGDDVLCIFVFDLDDRALEWFMMSVLHCSSQVAESRLPK